MTTVLFLNSADDLTNFSLAARRAWRRMPDRKVGRRAGSRCRIACCHFSDDRSLWKESCCGRNGLVGDRTSVINECLRNVVASAQRPEVKAS